MSYQLPKHTRICEVCGKDFRTGWLNFDHYFCSKACHLQFRLKERSPTR